MLAIVGNPNAIQSDTIHASAIRCLATVTDMLIAVRDQIMPIPFGTKPVPSLVEFLPWLFQAADMAEYDYTSWFFFFSYLKIKLATMPLVDRLPWVRSAAFSVDGMT